jgi:ferritin-like protein
MSNYHEPAEELSKEARDFSRALNSLKEEIEAVDWYHQRVDASDNEELKEIMGHNRDEEIEHACMTLEWLRRNMPGWDEELRNWLFKDGPITHHEGEETGDESNEETSDDLGIGKLK